MSHMSEKRIIVTGASSGIGEAVARQAVARGWRVLAVARRAERLEALAAETGCETFAADLTDEVQRRFLSGDKDGAAAMIPDDLVSDLHIVGSASEVREKVAAWEETGVTTLLLSLRTADEVRRVAEVLA